LLSSMTTRRRCHPFGPRHKFVMFALLVVFLLNGWGFRQELTVRNAQWRVSKVLEQRISGRKGFLAVFAHSKMGGGCHVTVGLEQFFPRPVSTN
jgi:hypothetical protein